MKYDINKIGIGTKVIFTFSLDGPFNGRISKGIVSSILSENLFKVEWNDSGSTTEDINHLQGISFPEENVDVAFENLKVAKMLKEVLGSI